MNGGGGEGEATALSPEEAFALLGDGTRLQILQTLGEAGESLTFSELFDRVDYETTANFSYHLERLEGHFLASTDDGYALREAGTRVVEAVHSGAVTEAPVLESTPVDRWWCPYCGAPAEVSYASERVWSTCPECAGTYGESVAPVAATGATERGFLGYARLPPAGLQGRTATEALATALTWGHLDFLATASGVCPRCAAPVERSVTVCEDHAADGDLCERCDCRHAVQSRTRCTNCVHEETAPFVLGRLAATPALLAFLAARGVNPVAPAPSSKFYAVLLDYEEEVRSTAPFEARFTVRLDGDALSLTVDDDLEVVAVERGRPPERERERPG